MKNPWTNVYGLARSLLAFGLLATLVCNRLDVLFQPDAFRAAHQMVPAYRISLFHLLAGSREGLQAARWIAAAVLALVVAGWRPRLTAVAHWWVAFSFAASTSVAEGGDQVHAILALLLIPVALTDPRRWHWSAWTPDARSVGDQVRGVLARSCLAMCGVQVAVIYFHAAVSKLFQPQWADGTAIYYWLTHPVYGMSEPLRSLAVPVLLNPVAVTMLTWGVMALELVLASALVMEPRRRALLLPAGILFHLGIVVGHGLFSFFFSMAGALVLYLRPLERPFAFPHAAGTARELAARLRWRRPLAPAPVRAALPG